MNSRWIGGAVAGLVLGVAGLWWMLRGVTVETPVTRDPAGDRLVIDAKSSLDEDRELASNELVANTRVVASQPSSDPAAFASPALSTSHFRGRVIEEAGSRPLPEFTLELRDATDRKVHATTDVDGRFIVPTVLAPGIVRVRPLDHPERKAAVRTLTFEPIAWESREVEIAVITGPTFRLSIAPKTVAARDLEARLILDRERNPTHVAFDPVREGNPPWVRLPENSWGRNGQHRLEVRSRDGLLFGAASVSRGFGVEPGLVRIDLEPRATIRGRVVTSDGIPLANVNVDLRLTSVAAEPKLPHAVMTEADGAFRFDLLPAGRAVLAASLYRFEPIDGLTVDLVAGQSTEQTIALRGLPSVGSIRTRVTSETGRFDQPSEISLSSFRDSERGEYVEAVKVEWTGEPGHRMGNCEFKDVPAGRYRVTAETASLWNELTPAWDPSSVETSPPSELTFVVRDSVARADLVFRVQDAATGTAIVSFDSYLQLGPQWQYVSSFGSGDTVLRGFPLTRTLLWRIDKQGYRSVLGSEKDFDLEEIRDGRTQRIREISLQTGWADIVHVTERETKKPMQGVRVLVDGSLAGVTDEAGCLSLSGDVSPGEIQVEHDGWRPTGKDSRSRSGSRKSLWIEVEMLPE